MTTILALDISTASTGYAIFTDGSPSLNHCGKIVMKHKTHGERLGVFEVAIIDLLNKYKPDIFYIEEIFHGLNVKTYKALAMYHSVAYKLSYIYFKQDPLVMTPSEVRKVVADRYKIKLTPTKEQKAVKINAKRLSYDFIIKHYDIPNTTFNDYNDISDALMLGLAASIRLEESNERSIQSPGAEQISRPRRSKKSVS